MDETSDQSPSLLINVIVVGGKDVDKDEDKGASADVTGDVTVTEEEGGGLGAGRRYSHWGCRINMTRTERHQWGGGCCCNKGGHSEGVWLAMAVNVGVGGGDKALGTRSTLIN